MSKYYSVLEQHIDGSWWYHKNWTFNSREEAEAFAKDFSERFDNRPTRIYEHDEPLILDEYSMGLEYLENDTFGFAGLVFWEKGKDVSGEFKKYIKH